MGLLNKFTKRNHVESKSEQTSEERVAKMERTMRYIEIQLQILEIEKERLNRGGAI